MDFKSPARPLTPEPVRDASQRVAGGRSDGGQARVLDPFPRLISCVNMIDQLIISGIAFGRNTIGLVVRPYETYRRIVDRGSVWELVYIAILAMAYFSLASLVKVAAAMATYALVVAAVWVVGQRIGGRGRLGGIALGWGYTILPTILWFLTSSLFYVVLPPPRTTSVAGIAFSALFLIFSATLFFWKLTLGYLTLRFGLKLDLARIVVVVAIVGPIVTVWSYGMYRLGIFRVPFLLIFVITKP